MTESKLNIYQRINAVLAEGIIYIKKGSAGQGTGILYDDLIAKLAPYLVKHGILVIPNKVGTSRPRTTPKGTYILDCDVEVSYINIDDPTDCIVNLVESHAMDLGDKAPAKLMTMATKISMSKVFLIESGDSEESREELSDNIYINPEQQQKLFDILCLPSGHYNEIGVKIAQAFKIGKIDKIKASKFDLIMNAVINICSKQEKNPTDIGATPIHTTSLKDRKVEYLGNGQ